MRQGVRLVTSETHVLPSFRILGARPLGTPGCQVENSMQRMLIVDDEEPILMAMQEYFRTFGYEVDCARELEEAEALLTKVCYSLVIADLRLTGIYGVEGLELVAYIRQRCPNTRMILLTAYGTPEIETEARRLGVDAFLYKPKPLPELAQIVFALLNRES